MAERNRQVSAIFFDLGETLVTRKAGWEGDSAIREPILRVSEYLKLKGNIVDENRLEDTLRRVRRRYQRLSQSTCVEVRSAIWMTDVLSEYGVAQLSPELLDGTLIAYYDSVVESVITFPETYGVLTCLALEGYKVAAVTNISDERATQKYLERVGLSKFFVSIIVSADVGWKKPHPKIFRAALDAVQSDPDESLFVGNNAVGDIKGAKDMGMRALLLVRDSKDVSDIPVVPDLVIRDLRGVLDFLGLKHG